MKDFLRQLGAALIYPIIALALAVLLQLVR